MLAWWLPCYLASVHRLHASLIESHFLSRMRACLEWGTIGLPNDFEDFFGDNEGHLDSPVGINSTVTIDSNFYNITPLYSGADPEVEYVTISTILHKE